MMNLEQAKWVCMELDIKANIDLNIDNFGNMTVKRINFWSLDYDKGLVDLKDEIIGLVNVDKLKKSQWGQDIDYKFDNVTFNRVEKCRIVGYRTEIEPAKRWRKVKVPIYECKE